MPWFYRVPDEFLPVQRQPGWLREATREAPTVLNFLPTPAAYSKGFSSATHKIQGTRELDEIAARTCGSTILTWPGIESLSMTFARFRKGPRVQSCHGWF